MPKPATQRQARQGHSGDRQLPQTQQLTIAVGRAVPQEREATQFIWPLWVQPLLFVQPLLSLLAFRVGPALLIGLLVYGGVRRLPSASQPSASQPSTIKLPTIQVPETQWPAIALPSIDLSEVNFPEMNLPEIRWPKQWPKQWPEQWPEVDWSQVKLPEVKLPEIKLPEIKLPAIDLAAKPDVGQGCRATAIARFNQLPPEKASWDEVDKQFSARYPDYPTPLEPTNPEHKVFIESWCEVANAWLDQAQ
ncbi:MAG: hypothetical protein HC771_15145 [Synechococcales cyanobacterium CRU_2_2]|nr:hypothetical protein [Synechococcales cyanobacterium CRU_2_2]